MNEELRVRIAHYYALGYTPKMMVDAIARDLGKRYSASYVRKVIWQMKREGLLARAAGGSLWDRALTDLEAAKLRAVAALDMLLDLKRSRIPQPVAEALDRAVRELEPVPSFLDEARSLVNHLKYLYSGVRVVRG